MTPVLPTRWLTGEKLPFSWHVDDLKISYRDEAMASEFAIALAKEFGPKTTILRGKVHDYLGMDSILEPALGL